MRDESGNLEGYVKMYKEALKFNSPNTAAAALVLMKSLIDNILHTDFKDIYLHTPARGVVAGVIEEQFNTLDKMAEDLLKKLDEEEKEAGE